MLIFIWNPKAYKINDFINSALRLLSKGLLCFYLSDTIRVEILTLANLVYKV